MTGNLHFKRGDVAVLSANVRRQDDWTGVSARDVRRLLRHVGRKCVILGDATGDGLYYDVAFTSGFKMDALSGHHLDTPPRRARG